MPPIEIPAQCSNLSDILHFRAKAQEHRVAFTFLVDGESSEQNLSYGELDARSRAIGDFLLHLGAGGERVLLIYPPGLEFIAALFGCFCAGAIAVPAYLPSSKRGLPRLEAVIRDAQVRVALTTADMMTRLSSFSASSALLGNLHFHATDNLASGPTPDQDFHPIAPGSIALLQYTSGSTSDPRGVMVTHQNLLQNERMIQQAFQQSCESIVVSWLPVYHDMGLIGSVLQPVFVGARCVLMSPASFLQRPFRWLRAISHYRATTSGGPNFAYDLCVKRTRPEERASLDLSSWRVAFNGAEPVRSQTLRRFADAFEQYGFVREALFPCYGLAEATLLVAAGSASAPPVIESFKRDGFENKRVTRAAPGEKKGLELVGCGHAWGDGSIVVVDPETMIPCEADAVGEIWVSGGNVGQGYWNREEETTRLFRACLADNRDVTYLRTGDLGFIQNGELFLAGRSKGLVIIRGRNHHSADIEQTVEQSHPAVRAGCCAAFPIGENEEERLVVVFEVERNVRNEELAEIIDAVRAGIGEVHELQVHSALVVQYGSIPKTSSGKVQRHVCRARFRAGELAVTKQWRETIATPEGSIAPATSRDGLEVRSEKAIAQHVARQIASRIGADAAMVDLERPIAHYGVDSLMAIEMKHSLESAFGVSLPIGDLLESSSINELATRACHRLATGDLSPTVATSTRLNGRTGACEGILSQGQQALWFLHQAAPESSAYNLTSVARIPMALDIPVFRRALELLVDRHPCLRTTFHSHLGEPVQRLHEREEIPLFIEDASQWSGKEQRERQRKAALEPFDLERGPLFRIALFQRSAQESTMMFVVHHIIADFWSVTLLIDELGRVYSAEKTGKDVVLRTVDASYMEYSRQQKEMLEGPAGERLWGAWKCYLADAPQTLDLPFAKPRPAVPSDHGRSLIFRLSPDRIDQVREFARSSGNTVFTILLAAFEALLNRYTGQGDFLVGSPASGRDRQELFSVVGYFANPVLMRARCHQNPTFREFLATVRADTLQALEHQGYPFPLLVERLQPQRDPQRAPLFQTMFTWLQAPAVGLPDLSAFAFGEPGVRVEFGEIAFESLPFEQSFAPVDLSLTLADVNHRFVGSLQFNPDLFDEPMIARLAEHYEQQLRDLVAHPNQRICDALLLTEAEQSQIIDKWNRTDEVYPDSESLDRIFEKQVRRSPDSIAVVAEEQQLTFDEVNRSANRIARYLREQGAGPDVPIGICVERSAAMIIAVLAILKSGSAYLPLDPSYPRERLAFMIEDTKASVVLTDSSSAALLAGVAGSRCIQVNGERVAASRGEEENLNIPITAQNLAYVIYTSGSTGKPKGVMVTHASVLNFCAAMDSRLRGEAGGVWLAVTSLSFDISFLELVWTLTRGIRVVLQADHKQSDIAPRKRAMTAAKAIEYSLFYFANDSDGPLGSRYSLLLEGAKFADQHGFTAVWTPERHFHPFGGLYPNPSVTGAAIAAITKRIQVRAGSVVLPLHDPIRVAEEWALVDNLSQGRVGVSFASGWHADDFVLAPENYQQRRDIMMRQLDTVRRLWRGEAITLKSGTGVPVEVRIRPRPVQSDLPVWITSAGNPETFRQAGEMGANLLTHLLGQTLEQLAENIATYRTAWRRGVGQSGGRVTLMLHTFVGSDAETVRETIREPFCNYLASSIDLAKGLLKRVGEKADVELRGDDLKALLSHSFHRYYETNGLFGTPESCLAMVERLRDIGVDEIACLIDFGVAADTVLASLSSLDRLKERSKHIFARDFEDYSLAMQVVCQQVTHLQCTPSLAAIVVNDPQVLASLSSLRKLFIGGEAFPVSLARRLREATKADIYNMYGPTETTIWSTMHAGVEGDNTVLIGRPIGNTQCYVTDRQLQPTPGGITGEVLIGGNGVVRGYWNRPDLTAARFVPDHLGARSGRRLYCTGDLARYLPDGNLEFLGRLDDQVKIRGHRVELTEIEETLRQYPGVSEAAVVVRKDSLGGPRLVAYWTPLRDSLSQTERADQHAADSHPTGAGENRCWCTLPGAMTIAHHGGPQTRVMVKEVFEQQVYLQNGISLCEKACIFDVGANIGLFTLFAHQRRPDAAIYAIEPLPPNFELLKENVTAHKVNAKLLNLGVSDRADEAVFIFYRQAAGLSGRKSSIEDDKQETRSIIQRWMQEVVPQNERTSSGELEVLLDDYLKGETYSCRVTTLSDIMREHEIKRIDLLKLDVEKSELDVLNGIEETDWPKIKQVVAEVHSLALREQVRALLESHGFAVACGNELLGEVGSTGAEPYVCMIYAIHPSRGQEFVDADRRTASGETADLPALTSDSMRRFLLSKLPEHMVPAVCMKLDQLPRTPNGKIDRRALPTPELTYWHNEKIWVQPETQTQKAVAEIWSRLLGVERPGIHDNFFDLGGHSLLATQLIGQLRARFSIDLALRDFLQCSTIDGLANAIEEAIVSRSSEEKLHEAMGFLRGLEEEDVPGLLAAPGTGG